MPDTTKNRSLPRGETNRTVKTCGKEVLPDVPGQAAKQPTMFFLRVRNAANQLVTGSSRISEEMRDLRRARGRQVCQACATVFGMILSMQHWSRSSSWCTDSTNTGWTVRTIVIERTRKKRKRKGERLDLWTGRWVGGEPSRAAIWWVKDDKEWNPYSS